jgi:HSP20 family protein
MHRKAGENMNKDKENKKQESIELQTRNGGKGLESTSPFSFVRRFAEDMERLFDDFNGYRFPSLFGRDVFPFRKEFENVAWAPQIEVLQHNGDLTVRADLPGLTQDDVKVELTDEALTISGERKEEKEEKREGFYRSERRYGTFYRQIPLPQGVDANKATAVFNNGVLEVTIQVPKTEPRGRKLEIKGGQETAKAKTATAK